MTLEQYSNEANDDSRGAMKMLAWVLILTTLMSVIVMVTFTGMIAEVDLREEKIVHRAEYIKWWTERALNEHLTQKEWTR